MSAQDGAGSFIQFSVPDTETKMTAIGKVVSISGLRQFRETLDNTGLTDTVQKTCPATLKKTEPVEVTLILDLATAQLPVFTVPEGVVIFLPKKTGLSNAAKITSSSAYITGYTTPELVHEQEMQVTYTLQIDNPVWTAST